MAKYVRDGLYRSALLPLFSALNALWNKNHMFLTTTKTSSTLSRRSQHQLQQQRLVQGKSKHIGKSAAMCLNVFSPGIADGLNQQVPYLHGVQKDARGTLFKKK